MPVVSTRPRDVLALAADLLAEPGARLLAHQRAPAGEWAGWLLLGGRGAGKSHALTAYLVEQVRQHPTLRARIIAPTLDDAVSSCVYGPAGILAADPTATFLPSSPGGASLRWPSGAECRLIGTPTPRDVDRLRAAGNRELDLWEEAAANTQLDLAWPQAALGRRIGRPRWVVATTPRPLPLIRQWVDDDAVAVTRATSRDNPHLDPSWVAAIEDAYQGTRLHRQEVLGEIVDDVEGALWRQEWIDRSRVPIPPELRRVVVGVDPANTTGTTGIVTVGIADDGDLYVLADASKSAHPSEWIRTVTALAAGYDAAIVAESDSGGHMVAELLRSTGTSQPVHTVTARGQTRGAARLRGPKAARAEPIAVLWERDPAKAHMVGDMPRLEDECCGWVPGDTNSPDRIDALVHACTWLVKQDHGPAHLAAGIRPEPAVPTNGSSWRQGGPWQRRR